MGYRIEQRRLESLASPQRFGLASALESVAEFCVKSLDLTPPGLSFFSATPCSSGEFPGRDSGDQKRRQGDPVVRVGDR